MTTKTSRYPLKVREYRTVSMWREFYLEVPDDFVLEDHDDPRVDKLISEQRPKLKWESEITHETRRITQVVRDEA